MKRFELSDTDTLPLCGYYTNTNFVIVAGHKIDTPLINLNKIKFVRKYPSS